MRAVLLLSVLAAAACGTTVPTAQQPAAVASADGLAPAGTQAQPQGTQGSSGSAGTGRTPGLVPASSGSAPAAGGAGAPVPATAARGAVTATTVTIGVSYAVNAGAANAAFGGKGITTGDEKGEAEAVIADLNARGGLLGRKVVPLFYQRDAQSTATTSSQAQTECTFYTQDHHVLAVLEGNGPVDWAMKPCLTQKGVIAVTAHIASLDDDGTARTQHVDVTGMSISRMATAMLSAAQSQHWLDPWNAATAGKGTTPAKVGLIGYDLPEVHRTVTDVIVPGLRRLGTTLVSSSTIFITVPQSTADTGASAAAVQASVLRMRSDGVTHVVFVDQGGALTLLYANEATSQSYYPRYLGSSSAGWQALLTGGDIQPKVLTGAVGAGWEPVIDLAAPARYLTPQAGTCLKLLKGKGFSFSDPNAEAVGLAYCDKVGFLRAAFRDGSWATDSLGALATARGLGSRFGPGRHDGAAAFYAMVFNGSDMTYVGAEQRL